MSQAETNPASPLGPGTVPKKPKKLVLCFDGTGNAFSGSNSDTNVVKLLSKLDRNDPNQFHYYQSNYSLALFPTTDRC